MTEGPEHKKAKEYGASYISIKYRYNYRFEYPVWISEKERHTFDAVFYHPDAVINYNNKELKVTLIMNKFARYCYNDELLKLPYKKQLDKVMAIVLEIDDYTKHSHKEQRINDGEAETLARKVFAPDVRIIRVKKEDIVEWRTRKELVPIQNCGKLIDDQCDGLEKTFLVK